MCIIYVHTNIGGGGGSRAEGAYRWQQIGQLCPYQFMGLCTYFHVRAGARASLSLRTHSPHSNQSRRCGRGWFHFSSRASGAHTSSRTSSPVCFMLHGSIANVTPGQSNVAGEVGEAYCIHYAMNIRYRAPYQGDGPAAEAGVE